MSSKGARNKGTKHVRNVDARHVPSLEESIIDKRLNIIPVGRQIHRTPPSETERVSYVINRADDSRISEKVIKDELCTQEMTTNNSCNGSSGVLMDPNLKEERKSVRRSSLTAASATTGNADPETFIQGMQGYQWTDTDLEFVYQSRSKKQVQQLQQELRDVQKALKTTRQLQDVAVAAHEKVTKELLKVLSCERVQEISKEVLLKSQSSLRLEGLDFKTLLARLKVSDVQNVTSEERTNVCNLNTEVAKSQAVREKHEQLKKDIYICQVSVDQIKVNIQTLTADVASLESQLSTKHTAPLSTKPRKKVQRGPTIAQSTPKPATNVAISPKLSADPKPTPSTPKASSATKPSTPRSVSKGSTDHKPPTPRSVPKSSSEPKPSTPQMVSKGSPAPKPPTARSDPKPSSEPKPSFPRLVSKGSPAPKPPTARSDPKPLSEPKPSSSRSVSKGSTATKPPNAQSDPKPSSEPKPSSSRSVSKGSTAPKPPSARSDPKSSSEPKPSSSRSVSKGSTATKPPTARSDPKPSSEPKPSSSRSVSKGSTATKPPSARSDPKPSSEPKPSSSQSVSKGFTATKPPSARSDPKSSSEPKPSSSRSVSKGSTAPKPPSARSDPKSSSEPKPSSSRSVSKGSTAPKPPSARSVLKTSTGNKVRSIPSVPEADDGGLRRSKRIAAKKEK